MDPVSSPASAISTSKMFIMVAKRRVPCESRAPCRRKGAAMPFLHRRVVHRTGTRAGGLKRDSKANQPCIEPK
jgi:hypothetical protein